MFRHLTFLYLPAMCFKFDALVAALPLNDGGEEAQLKKIAELQVARVASQKFVCLFYVSVDRTSKTVHRLVQFFIFGALKAKTRDIEMNFIILIFKDTSIKDQRTC